MKTTAAGLPGISDVSASFQSNATFIKRIGTSLLFGTILVYATGAKALVIDSFEDLLNDSPLAQSTQGDLSNSPPATALSGVAGGTRGVTTNASSIGAGGNVTASGTSTGGGFRASSQGATGGVTTLTFDSGDSGLGGLDLTCEDEFDPLCENDELVIEGIEVDGDGEITVTLTDVDGNVDEVTQILADGDLPFDLDDFIGVDPTDIDEITVEIAGTDPNSDFEAEIDGIGTAPSGDDGTPDIAQTSGGSSPLTVPEPGTLVYSAAR